MQGLRIEIYSAKNYGPCKIGIDRVTASGLFSLSSLHLECNEMTFLQPASHHLIKLVL